jgi:hypothetical protein
MRCYECGYQNSSDAKVCIKCGTKLSQTAGSDSAPAGRPAPAPNPAAPPAPSGGRPTIMGRASEAPAWDTGKYVAGGTSPAEPASGHNRPFSVISCSSCGYYPLRSNPCAQTPCVNCGFTGDGVNSPKSIQHSDESLLSGSKSSKTVRIQDIRIGRVDQSLPSLVLTDTATGKEIEFEGAEIPLNRADLDPSNTTISSTHHLTLHLDGEGIGVEDKSSNGATFVQVVGKVNVVPGTMLIIGNKVFRIDIKQ